MLSFNNYSAKHMLDQMFESNEKEVIIPLKLADTWDPIIKIVVDNYACNALCDLGSSASNNASNKPKNLYDLFILDEMSPYFLNLHLVHSSNKKALGKVYDVMIYLHMKHVPIDFIIVDMVWYSFSPIILRTPLLRIVGAIVHMKEANIKF